MSFIPDLSTDTVQEFESISHMGSIECYTVTACPVTTTGMAAKWNAVFLNNSDITIFHKKLIHIVIGLSLARLFSE